MITPIILFINPRLLNYIIGARIFFILLTVIFFQPKTVPEIGLKYKNNFVFSTNYYFNQKYVIFLYKLCKIINKNWNYIKEFLNPDGSDHALLARDSLGRNINC